jgi:tetratricopeptide (TPR) repeat protein
MHLLYSITAGLEFCRIDSVDRDIAAFLRVAEPLNRPQYRWYAWIFRAQRALMQGRYAEAGKYAEEALAIGARVGDANAITSFGVHVGVQLFEAGRAGELVGHAEDFHRRLPGVEGWPFVRMAMLGECGRLVEARAEFERIAANDFAAIPRTEQWMISAMLTADLCHQLGDARRAEILRTQLLPGADHGCVVGYGIAYFGTVARRLGNLAATLERWDEAEHHFVRARELEERLGATPWVAYASYDHARMLAARGNARGRANDLRARAHEIAHQLGMKGLIRKLES